MSSVIETLASKKKLQTVPAVATILPVLQKEHEGECGEGCTCGEDADEGGCCGG